MGPMAEKRPFWVGPLAVIASARPVLAVLKRTIPGIDRWLMRSTRGRVSVTAGLPSLLLTTTGRKSGQPRSAPLLYVSHGEDWVVIGTNFAGPSHPAWYLNLKADSRAEILVGGEQIAVTAREALPEERPELWAKAIRLYPGFETYRSRISTRQVPIMVLSRAKSSAARA
jgi:deazaflavin-dependent oxidoreductase (nitroreductase family)